jgi:hypothetical protein
MPPDPESSAALSRRLSSPRTASFLDCPKPFVELARLDRLHVGLDKPRQLSRFARRDVASGNCRRDRSHCASCITSGPKRGQLKAHQPFAPRWPARFEQSQEQMIRVSAPRGRCRARRSHRLLATGEHKTPKRLSEHAGHPYARAIGKPVAFCSQPSAGSGPAGLNHLHASISTATQNANSSAGLAFARSS